MPTVLYRNLTATAIVFASIVAGSLILGRAPRTRVEGHAALMEFLG